MYREAGVGHEVAPGPKLEGREAIAKQAATSFHSVPDAVCTRRKVSEAPDTVTIEWSWDGAHLGDVEGRPAKGERVDLKSVGVCGMHGGLIREQRVYRDSAALLAG
jgi:hypothetical protein